MLLTMKSLNEDATLNNFQEGSGVSIPRGGDSNILLRLYQTERPIRYVPLITAVITIVLLKSDGTTISKTATFPFADDRSIIKISVTAAESQDLIGQNLIATVVEGSVTSVAILSSGLQIVSSSQAGC